MKFFSKTPKPNPKISTQGIDVEFHRDYEGWEFSYRGTDFLTFALLLILPTRAELDVILMDIESLKPEMKGRLEKGLKEWSDAKLNDGETYSVNLETFATKGTFMVSYSGGDGLGRPRS